MDGWSALSRVSSIQMASDGCQVHGQLVMSNELFLVRKASLGTRRFLVLTDLPTNVICNLKVGKIVVKTAVLNDQILRLPQIVNSSDSVAGPRRWSIRSHQPLVLVVDGVTQKSPAAGLVIFGVGCIRLDGFKILNSELNVDSCIGYEKLRWSDVLGQIRLFICVSVGLPGISDWSWPLAFCTPGLPRYNTPPPSRICARVVTLEQTS